MDARYPKESYTLFYVWLALLAAAVVFFAFHANIFPGIGAGQNLGLLVFAALDLLYLLILFTQSVYWISGITYEQAAEAGPAARRRCALRHLGVLVAATLLFLFYCFGLKDFLPLQRIRDSLVAGGLVCAAALAGARIRL